MPHSLRTFLESIDNRMLHIHDPVDPLTQVGYLCSESQGPLMFHNMPGFDDWRLTDILIKDRAGQAAAFGLDAANEVCPYLAEQMATKSDLNGARDAYSVALGHLQRAEVREPFASSALAAGGRLFRLPVLFLLRNPWPAVEARLIALAATIRALASVPEPGENWERR